MRQIYTKRDRRVMKEQAIKRTIYQGERGLNILEWRPVLEKVVLFLVYTVMSSNSPINSVHVK